MILQIAALIGFNLVVVGLFVAGLDQIGIGLLLVVLISEVRNLNK